MAITFPGLGSGMDIDSMIQNMLLAKTEKLQNYKKDETNIKNKEDVFGDLRKILEKLEKNSTDLSNINSLLSKKATSSGTSVGIMGTDDEAIDGTYVIDVKSMATSSVVSFKPNTPIKPDTVLNSTGSVKEFVYEVNGQQQTIQLADGATAQDLVNNINKNSGNLGVRASLLQDGDSYVFRLQSTETGSKNSVSIVDSVNGIPGWSNSTTEGTWTSQAGQDATYKIDGYPSTGWITSSSNTITGAIPGVSINLQGAGTSAITVATSSDKMVEKVEEFVTTINEALSMIEDITKPTQKQEGGADSDKKPTMGDGYNKGDHSSIFYNNNYLTTIQQKLEKIVTSRLPGYTLYDSATETGDKFSSLGNLGITIDSSNTSDTYGQLIIDKDRLKKAIEEDPKGVTNLIGANGKGSVTSPDNSFYFQGSINGITKPGSYEVEYSVDTTGNIINATIGGEPAGWDPKTQTLSVSTGDPKGIAIKITDFTNKDYTGTINIQSGVATTLSSTISEMFLPNGDMLRLSETVKKEMEGIDKTITKEEEKLKDYESNLRARFTAMDLKISQMNSQLNLMASFIGSSFS